MRKDYNYIDKATSICLTTTEAGRDYADAMPDIKPNSPRRITVWFKGMFDLLASIDEQYFEMPSEKSFSTWFEVYKEKYKSHYGVETSVTWSIFAQAFYLNFMTVRKVIWDYHEVIKLEKQ